jgi:hypothetical protein
MGEPAIAGGLLAVLGTPSLGDDLDTPLRVYPESREGNQTGGGSQIFLPITTTEHGVVKNLV